jgi:ribonucleotide reductase, class II
VSELSPYQNFIAVSRYARWLDDENRRETWPETVQRYIEFMRRHLSENYNYDPKDPIFAEVRDAAVALDIVPSMRAIMTAGEALERNPLASYNCSFVAVNDPRVFDEAMYVLMNGTGLGFSVEQKYTDQLPVVPESLEDSNEVIVVGDSKEGWAKAYRSLIGELYNGRILKWDVSGVRPSGARLKTFGGRASGPQPLVDLFNFTINTFKNAAGRRLHPIECHDIMCKVGDIVVVGGVRRSALISLSDLDDFAMAKAKSGTWWENNGQRALANNSASYYERPSSAQFLREWRNLIESQSGERGIFNLAGARKHAERSGRNGEKLQGTNPCVTADTWVMTTEGPRRVADLVGAPFDAVVDGKPFATFSNGFFSTGVKDVLLLTTRDGHSLRLTANHKVMTDSGWVEAGSLTAGQQVVLHDHLNSSWGGRGTEDEGYVLGHLVGDGTFTPKGQPFLSVWSTDEGSADTMDYIWGIVKGLGVRSDNVGWRSVSKSDAMRCGGKGLKALAESYGIVWGNKTITDEVEEASSAFYVGFLRGLFDTDGHIEGESTGGGVSVRLSQADRGLLEAAQRMLLRLGIRSVIRGMHDGDHVFGARNGYPDYQSQPSYRLIIAGAQAARFMDLIGFKNPRKATEWGEKTAVMKRGFYSKPFVTTVESIVADGKEEVFDVTVADVHAFDANGLYVHNCGEILLRDMGLCNLSEVIIRDTDSVDDVKRKVRLASIVGTWQSTLTDFPYLRSGWKANAEEERLLGVSLTGIYGNKKFNNPDDEGLPKRLQALRKIAREANVAEAEKVGINPSVAVTTVKPSGCRPWDGLTTTDKGILTLEEMFSASGHVEGESWCAFDGYEALQSVDGTKRSRLSKTFDNGKAEVFSVNMHYGLSVESTEEHPWFVSRRNIAPGKYEDVNDWVETKNLREGDILEIAVGVYQSTHEQEFKPMNLRSVSMRGDAADIIQPTAMTPDIAWMLGYLWGDGSLSESKYRIRWIDENIEHLEKANRVLKENFGISGSIHKASQHRKAFTLEVGNKTLWHWLMVNGVTKYDRDSDGLALIPEVVRRSSTQSVVAFLAGLLDSDGWVGANEKENRVTFTGADERFMKHIQDVALAVGIVLGRSHNTGGESFQTERSMYLMAMAPESTRQATDFLRDHSVKIARREDTSLPWPCERGSSKTRTLGKVQSVESIGFKETFDVEVEDTHWFYAGAVKSHNTVSQLALVSSGIHPWHSEYYIRTVRGANNDPLTQLMKDAGVPNEPDFMKPEKSTVFSFPTKAPEGAVTRKQISALDHLRLYAIYRDNYTDHNVSITVSVKESEWVSVGAWVYENWDIVGGVSFLPYSDHTYQQSPYQDCTEEEYEAAMATFPKEVRFADLAFYETEDGTTGNQTLACAAGNCEVVDIS